MTALQRITLAVEAAQNDGCTQSEIAAVLISFGARYALEIGWAPETIANGQRLTLAEHLAVRASERTFGTKGKR